MSDRTISLSAPTHKLQAFLSSGGTPDVLVFYHDVQIQEKISTGAYPIGVQSTALDGTTAKDILDAPARNICRHVDVIICSNDEGAEITLTIVLEIAGVDKRLWKRVLDIDETFTYFAGEGEEDSTPAVSVLATVGDGPPPLIPGGSAPLSMTTDGRLRVTANGDQVDFFSQSQRNTWGELQTEYKFSGSVWKGW